MRLKSKSLWYKYSNMYSSVLVLRENILYDIAVSVSYTYLINRQYVGYEFQRMINHGFNNGKVSVFCYPILLLVATM